MQKSNYCREDVRDVEDDQSDGSYMEKKDNREVNIPSFLIPFLI